MNWGEANQEWQEGDLSAFGSRGNSRKRRIPRGMPYLELMRELACRAKSNKVKDNYALGTLLSLDVNIYANYRAGNLLNPYIQCAIIHLYSRTRKSH